MKGQIERSLRETILNSELPTLVNEVGEISLDSFLDDGFIRNIPVLRTVLALGQTFGSVRDYLFAKKLLKFLKSIASLDPAERASLVRRLDQDPGFGEYAGERLIDLLSRLDDEKKPELVGNALKLYLKGVITSEELQRINYALERFLLCDLGELRSFCATASDPRATDGNPVTANFINAGLAYVQSGYGGAGVHPTETAGKLLQVIDKGEI